MAKAHVICCNDRVEAVVIGSEDFAKQETERLRGEYFKRHPWFNEDQRRIFYWHHHTVDLLEQISAPKPTQSVLYKAILARSKQL